MRRHKLRIKRCRWPEIDGAAWHVYGAESPQNFQTFEEARSFAAAWVDAHTPREATA